MVGILSSGPVAGDKSLFSPLDIEKKAIQRLFLKTGKAEVCWSI